MITNFIAAVTFALVTNVIENVTGYERWDPAPCPDAAKDAVYGLHCLALHWQGVNPTAKDVVTTVKLVETATFAWGGKTNAVTNERVMSSDTKHMRKGPEWVEDTATSHYHSMEFQLERLHRRTPGMRGMH
jgi:hypothetical protein